MPPSSLPNLHQSPHRLAPLIEELRPVRKVPSPLPSIHKAVADLLKSFETIIKELKNCQEEMGEQQSKKIKEQE